MRAWALVGLVLLAAGCAYTAQELQQQGSAIKLTSSLEPSQAAGCIARGIEGVVPTLCAPLVVSVRSGAQPQTYELLVAAGGGGGVSVYGLVGPAQKGALATIWIRPGMCHSAEGLRDAIERQCR
jgi:hypothetical protein